MPTSTNPTPETPDTIHALLTAIASGDDAVTELAAQGMRGQPHLLPALRPLLADQDSDRRWWAVRVLALIGEQEAVELLIERLTDTDVPTRCAAALALGELRAGQAIHALSLRLADESGWVRDSAMDALALIGEPALPALVEALSDPREGVRVRAAGALRKIVVPGLAGYTLDTYPSPFWPVLGALFRALNDPNRLVRHNAGAALDRLGLLDTVLFSAG
jgi:HEAT repeat protein